WRRRTRATRRPWTPSRTDARRARTTAVTREGERAAGEPSRASLERRDQGAMNIAATTRPAWSMLAMLALAVYVAATGAATAAPQESSRMAAPPARSALTAADSARHVLQRFAYGPRAGQVAEVAREGALHWLEVQLAVDGHGDPRLAALERRTPALALDPDDWARRFAAARRAKREGTGGEERAEARELLGQVRALVIARAVTAED